MADITVTPAQVSIVDPGQAELYDFEVPSTESLTVGDAVFVDSNGQIQQADANGAGEQQFAGIVVKITGRGATVLKSGRCYGFDLSGMAYFDIAYLSDTAGAIADAAGTMTVHVGKVVSVAESGSVKKALYVEADWLRAWA